MNAKGERLFLGGQNTANSDQCERRAVEHLTTARFQLSRGAAGHRMSDEDGRIAFAFFKSGNTFKKKNTVDSIRTRNQELYDDRLRQYSRAPQGECTVPTKSFRQIFGCSEGCKRSLNGAPLQSAVDSTDPVRALQPSCTPLES